MDQVHVIRHKLFVEGKSARSVALEMGVSRNTVRKYREQSEPNRTESKSRARPKFDLVKQRLEQILESWSQRSSAKQRITASRVHRELVSEGYNIGVTAVRDYLRQRRLKHVEISVPLVHHAGDSAQVDFFQVQVELAGFRVAAWMFLIRLMYSGRDFVAFYRHADQVSFLDGHVRAFSHLGCVPQRLVYDNLKAAVRKLAFPKRELTQRFRALVNHYLFEVCFARPYRGNDKGGVESRGKGVRLQELVPIPRADSLLELSRQVQERLDEQSLTRRRHRHEPATVAQLFEQEKRQMLALPNTDFDARHFVLVSASRRSIVKLEGAYYSIPTRWKGLDVEARIGPESVELCCLRETLTRPRVRFGQRCVRYSDYLDELSRKPQALRQVAAELIAELGEPYAQLWRLLVDVNGPRRASRIMAKVIGALETQERAQLDQHIRWAIDNDELEPLSLIPHADCAHTPTIQVPHALAHIEIESCEVKDFDVLLKGGHDD